MKRLASIAILSAAVLAGGVAQLPLAPNRVRADDAAKPSLPAGSELVEKYITATGGREAYKKLTSRTSKGTYDIPAQAMKASITLSQQSPDKGLLQMEFPGLGEIKQGCDGETVWANDPMQGVRILTGGEREALIRQFRFDSDVEWQKYYKSAETLGVEDVNGKPAYKVKLTPATAEGSETISYYDKESGLMVRMDTTMQSQMGNLAVVSNIGDYKEVDGIKIPMSTTQEVAGTKISLTLESVEHNKPIDAALLELPEEVKKLKAQMPATQSPATQPTGK